MVELLADGLGGLEQLVEMASAGLGNDAVGAQEKDEPSKLGVVAASSLVSNRS